MRLQKKAVPGLVAQSCPALCDPTDCRLPGSSVHGESPGKNTGVGSCQPRDQSQVFHLQGGLFTV